MMPAVALGELEPRHQALAQARLVEVIGEVSAEMLVGWDETASGIRSADHRR